MMPAEVPEALLARLCEDARDCLNPQLDPVALEAAVLARIARDSATSLESRPTARRYFWPVASLMAAAAFALVAATWLVQRPSSVAGPARGQLAHEPGVDGAALTVGQYVEARVRPITVKHAGKATWRLSAPGRILVVETGPRITLALEQGRIEADVVPQPQPEVLAIEVARVRVAVHGTVFSVQRRGDIADVVVKEGSVQVGSVEQRGATRGRLLVAPARLSIDVRPTHDDSTAGSVVSAPVKDSVPSSPKPVHPTGAATPIPTVTPALEERPASDTVEQVWDSARQRISACFAAQAGVDPNVRVSFGTQVELQIAPAGAVSITAFNPPVPQTVFSCAERSVAQVSTTATELGSVISRPIILRR